MQRKHDDEIRPHKEKTRGEFGDSMSQMTNDQQRLHDALSEVEARVEKENK